MKIPPTAKKWARRALIATAVLWAGVLSYQAFAPHPTGDRRGLTGADPMVLTGGGGLRKVNAGSGLSGSGTTSNALIVNAGSGLTFSSGALITNTGDGLEYSSGKLLAHPNNYQGTHLEWVDDFLQGGTNSITATFSSWGSTPYAVNQSGTGVSVAGTVGTTTRPGITEQNTGTTATGRTALFLNGQTVDFNSGSWTFETVIGWPTLSDTGTPTDSYAQLVGFADSSSAVDIVDGCYFLYDSQNVATSGPNSGKVQKLSCWCASNSARTAFLMDGTTVSNESFTTVNAPVAALTLPSTNIYHLKVVMTGTTRAEFFVNGTKSCDINTNIPSGSTRLTGVTALLIKNAGTTARTSNIDWMRVAVDLTSTRSP